ncbi:MAG: four helix bundle protein [Bacteroidia bacterium]|nr:four helix bundle protein [Bacteroidia bacterium]
MSRFFSFEELECWKEAADLRKRIRVIVKTFPQEEKYKLVDQLIRASRSATANIAEGFGRYHYKENAKFCRNSRGSLNEIIDHLIVAREEEYISDKELAELKIKTNKCILILNGYIKYLLKNKKEE